MITDGFIMIMMPVLILNPCMHIIGAFGYRNQNFQCHQRIGMRCFSPEFYASRSISSVGLLAFYNSKHWTAFVTNYFANINFLVSLLLLL